MKYRKLPSVSELEKRFLIIDGTLCEQKTRLPSGWIDFYGYQSVCFNGVHYKGHRVAYKLHYKEEPNGEVDHINGDILDNSKSNLRVVNKSLNAKNSKLRTDSTSGCPGVSFDRSRNKWRAYVNSDGQRIELGRFQTIFDAACARKSLQNKLEFQLRHGELA